MQRVDHNRVNRMRALTAGRLLPEGRAAFVFNDVDIGMDKLLKGIGWNTLPSPYPDLEIQFFLDVGNVLEDHLVRRFQRQTNQAHAQIGQLVKDAETRPYHLQLRLDF